MGDEFRVVLLRRGLALVRYRQVAVTALRILIIGACSAGIWHSAKMTRADFLFRRDTVDSLHSAIRLEPDAWEYFMRLAQLDEEHAPDFLKTALRLNPYDAQADIELGLRAEAEQDYASAERYFLQAFAVDDTYVPRWSLAGFYLRRRNRDAFWTWARKAADMPAQDIGALFDLAWRIAPNSEEVAGHLLTGNPEVTRQYLTFLLHKDQLRSAGILAPRLLQTGTPEVDLPALLTTVNRMLAANEASSAIALWRDLIQRGWVAGPDAIPYNANFTHEPLSVAFDWAFPSVPGMRALPGQSGLEAEFTGEEPEDCVIADQFVVLESGNYVMEYTYRTRGILPDTGIQWQLVDPATGTILATSPYLASDADQKTMFTFSIEPPVAVARLRLIYKRVPGTPRVVGTLSLSSTRIRHQA